MPAADLVHMPPSLQRIGVFELCICTYLAARRNVLAVLASILSAPASGGPATSLGLLERPNCCAQGMRRSAHRNATTPVRNPCRNAPRR